MNDRLRKQLAFALEIDKEKNIFRQTHISGHGRNENDAEHAWHMAVMSFLLQEYANEEVNIDRVMRMCLIHDIVEIDAGDTYAYDEEGLSTQKAREDAAKERIFSLLPEDQKAEFIALFDEFEAAETAESRYAHAMDNLQPLLLNDANGGGDWREHEVRADQVYGRQGKTRMGSETLFQVTDRIIRKNIAAGNIRPSDGPQGTSAETARIKCSSAHSASGTNSTSDGPQRDAGVPEERPFERLFSGGSSVQKGQPMHTLQPPLRKEKLREKAEEERTVSKLPAEGRDLDHCSRAFAELTGTVEKLLAPDGCPWDRAQTHETLKAPCIEEAAEVIGGINILRETGKADSLCEELGDLLLQVIMHGLMAEKEGLFTLEDVIRGINAKMIRRHPHVFGERSREYFPAEALENLHLTGEEIPADWKKIKALEKRGREWEAPYLFHAFDEAEALIETARKRKARKQT